MNYALESLSDGPYKIIKAKQGNDLPMEMINHAFNSWLTEMAKGFSCHNKRSYSKRNSPTMNV